MALWGNKRIANNSPIFAAAQFGQPANAANRDLLFGNTTANGFGTGETIGQHAANDERIGGKSVSAITIVTPGTGFTARPTLAVAAAPNANGVNATATAVGILVTVAINAAGGGSGYANGDVLTIAGGTGTAATANVVSTNSTGGITNAVVRTPGAYTALPTLSNNQVTDAGAGANAGLDLTIGVGPATITEKGLGYTSIPAITVGGAGGSGANAQATIAEQGVSLGAHKGWNLVKVGAGSRSTRTQVETLVAIGGDMPAS